MEAVQPTSERLLDLKPVTFLRTVWHTAEAKDLWAPRLAQIRAEWYKAEMESVAAGDRPATQQVLDPPSFLDRVRWANEYGLKTIVKRSIKAINGYAHAYEAGDDMVVVVFAKGNDETLGYPPCCQEWWDEVFPTYLDPVWQWAGGQAEVKADPACNPVLRYLGVRGVPHITCSPTCAVSHYFSRGFTRHMEPKVWAWAKELLSMPMSWDCYRSVAIVKLPPFRLVFGSNSYAERHVVNISTV